MIKQMAQRLFFGLVVALGLGFVEAHASYTPPNGDWREEVEEFRVKVLGGWIRVQRDYVFDHWQVNARWNPLAFEQDPIDGSVKRITRNEAAFDAQGDAWAFGKRALIRKQTISFIPTGSGEGASGNVPAGGLGLQNVAGYRWLDRDGNWIDYTLEGKAVAYGDRNNVAVWFEYGSGADAGHIVKVRDHFGRTVLVYRYGTDGNLVEVREILLDGSVGRSVQFTWSGNLLLQATDVLGNKSTYSYENNKLKTETDQEGRTRTLTYGPTGRIQKVTEPDGSEITYQYDYDKLKRVFYVRADGPTTSAGVPVQERWYDVDGRETRFDLNGVTQSSLVQDSAAKTRSSTDAQGRATQTTLDDYDNPIATVYPDGSQTSAKYSPIHGQLLEEVDELGTKTVHDYDGKGNLLKTTEAVGLPEQRITEYTRDSYGQVLTETRKGSSVILPNGSTAFVADATTTNTWDDKGNLASQTDAEGNRSQFAYDSQGNVTQLIDPLNQVWSSTWNGKGQLLARTDPLGHGTIYSYDKVGNRLTSQNGEGQVTSYGYDKKNRLARITNPLSQSQTLAYDSEGRLAQRKDEAGNALQNLAYDLQGRLTQETDGNGNSTAYIYSQDGNSSLPTEIRYPSFTRKLTWDSRNRNTQNQEVLDAATAYISAQSYDKRGNLTALTDRNGKVTSLAYDALGRLAQVTDPDGGVTRYTYDPRDNLLALTDPNGNTTRYGYDRNNRRTQETRPLGSSLTWRYDAVGNLIEQQDPKGNRLAYAYDVARHRIQETHTNAGANSPARTISYTYDKADQLTAYDDSQGNSASYQRDAAGRKTSEVQNINGNSYTFKSGYTATGQLSQFSWPDGYQAAYAYDGNQGLQSITLPEGTISIQAQKWNQATQVLLPGGTRINRDYDALMRLTRNQVLSAGSVTLLNHQLSYDPESNLAQKQTEYGPHAYQYDNLYRLSQADNPTQGTEKYSYDKVGNRLTDNRTNGLVATNTWTYDQDNKLTGYASQTGKAIAIAWDTNGSLIKESSADPDHNQQYVYDASNRLVEVQDKDGNTIATYSYDPFGRRIAKAVYRENGQILTTPKRRSYLYSDQGLIGEADESGALTQRYGWKPDSSWGTDPVFVSARRTAAAPSAALENFYALTDHLGTTQKLVDHAGQVSWEGRATAFGEMQVLAGSQIENNLRFPGQYADSETNTFYNYFRDYDPSIGRYIQRDPIGLGGGVNGYGYALQNPLHYTDQTGEAVPIAIAWCATNPACVTAVAATAMVVGNTIAKTLKVIDKAKDYRSEPCYRYQLTDCHGDVVYIGITNNPVRRLKEHEREGRGIIGKYSCSTCPITANSIDLPVARTECDSLERETIQAIKPIFNTKHNPEYPFRALQRRADWRRLNCGECGG